MSGQLRDQRVLVIGGVHFLGAAIARRAQEEGATVIVGAREPGHRDNAVRIDLLDEASIAAAAEQIGPVDHVVSTASLPHDLPLRDLDHDRIVAAFEAKVIGPLLVAKHFDIRQSLLLFSGVVGWRPGPSSTVKGVTNGAVSFAAQHLASELAPVRVNAISPGIIDSGAWDTKGSGKDTFLRGAAQKTLVGRTGTVDDVTDAVLWLLSAGYISGETIHLEGGRRA